MKIFYNTSGTITDSILFRYIFQHVPPSPSFIEIDEIEENRGIINDLRSERAIEYAVIDGALTHNSIGVVLVTDQDKSQLKAEFQETITQLLSIENAVSPTNAQVIAAVKFLAKTLRLLLKLLARMI